MAHAHLLAQAPGAGGPRGQRARAVRQAGLGRDLEPVGPQEVRERLAVPQLLVHPAGQERGDVRVLRRPRGQQVAQVDDRVCLDVHHVVEAHHVPVGQGVVGDVLPVDPGEVDLLRVAQVAVDVELDDAPWAAPIGAHGRLYVPSATVDQDRWGRSYVAGPTCYHSAS